MTTSSISPTIIMCDALRAAGLDPLRVLRDGGDAARGAAGMLRAEARHPALATALDLWAEGAAIDHAAYRMPASTPERVAEHGRAREFYQRAAEALGAPEQRG